jgi:hypothetical protein
VVLTLSIEVKTMISNMEPGALNDRKNASVWEVPSPEEVPLYSLVPVRGPEGELLDAYRGVQRQDTKQIVSVVGERYQLVQHRSIAQAVHAVGQTLEKPDMTIESLRTDPRFRKESIKLYAGGRRMEVKPVVGRKFRLDSANEIYPAGRVFNSLDGAWAVRSEVLGVRVACCNQLHAGAKALAEFRELHLSSQEDLLAQMERAIYEALDRFDGALDLYKDAMEHQMPIREFVPALESAGMPHRHVMTMAEGLPEYFGSTLWGQASKWDLYQLATYVTSHKVSVNPERERMLEHAAARALLLEGAGEDGPTFDMK